MGDGCTFVADASVGGVFIVVSWDGEWDNCHGMHCGIPEGGPSVELTVHAAHYFWSFKILMLGILLYRIDLYCALKNTYPFQVIGWRIDSIIDNVQYGC